MDREFNISVEFQNDEIELLLNMLENTKIIGSSLHTIARTRRTYKSIKLALGVPEDKLAYIIRGE